MMNHASKKVTQMARGSLSVMGASNHAKPLLEELQKECADLSTLTAVPLAA
jgi:hypothetical protein